MRWLSLTNAWIGSSSTEVTPRLLMYSMTSFCPRPANVPRMCSGTAG